MAGGRRRPWRPWRRGWSGSTAAGRLRALHISHLRMAVGRDPLVARVAVASRMHLTRDQLVANPLDAGRRRWGTPVQP
jgi:hypothetical protein